MKTHNYPGKLIVAEGLDGTGKATQLNLLKNWLEIKGFATMVYKRKNSQLIAETINKAKETKVLNPLTYSLIHVADFSDLLNRNVIPALKAGFVVLFNKYVYTSIAKDSLRGHDKDWVQKLYEFAPEPDLTLYFQSSLDQALERMNLSKKDKDHYDSGMDIGFGPTHYQSLRNFQAKLLEQYELMAKLKKFSTIPCDKSIHSQQSKIRKLVQPLLKQG
jgi:dTMP kinase